MERKKVLNIAIDKVICSNKDGEAALPGLESGEAFIRIELRGGASQKISTPNAKLKKDTLAFDTTVSLDLTEDSTELRLLLCKKKDGVATQNTVLSAAGIYVKDILRAAPIVKYFDLFKSYGAGFGGKVKLSLTISDAAAGEEPKTKEPATDVPTAMMEPASPGLPKKKKGGFPLKLLLLATAGGVVALMKTVRS